MRYYRCRCSRIESWGNMPPPHCMKCPQCGARPAESPDLHIEPVDHDYYEEIIETDEGPKSLTLCRYCLESQAHINQAEMLLNYSDC